MNIIPRRITTAAEMSQSPVSMPFDTSPIANAPRGNAAGRHMVLVPDWAEDMTRA